MRLYLGGVVEFKKKDYTRGVVNDYLNGLILTLLATATDAIRSHAYSNCTANIFVK